MPRFTHALTLFLVGNIILFVGSLAAAEPLHVAVTGPSAELADQITAELSHDEGLLTVERSQIELLLAEQALSQSSVEAETRIRAGRLLGVDVFLHVRAVANDQWQMDVIDGASGQVLASRTSAGGRPGLAAAHDILRGVASSRKGAGGVRLAVIDFGGPAENQDAAAHLTGLRLAEQLRIRLAESGLTVLDRTATAQVSDEQALAQSGLIQTPGQMSPLLGADLVITGQWRAEQGTLQLRILDARKAGTAAEETFPLDSAATLSEPMMKWTLAHSVGAPAAEAYAWASSIAAEAMIPFYRGVTLFEQGKPIEATDEFEKAYQLNDKFDEAYLWEARCYDAAGLAPLAEAERRFAQRSLVGWGISSLTANTSTDGITFLGMINQEGDAATCRKLEVLVTDAMARASHRLLLPANIAELRDEYDVLVGTPNSRGVTWNQAPGFLTRLTLSGSLAGTAGQRILQLRLNDTVRGNLLGSTDVALAGDVQAWNEQIAAAVRALLAAGATADAAQATPLAALPPRADLARQLGREGNIAVLQLALADPDYLAANFRAVQRRSLWNLSDFLRFGLREYLLTHVSAGCPQRPWLQLEEIGAFLPCEPVGELYSDRKIDPLPALAEFARAHPADLPGAVAEYMLLWETMAALPYPELEKRFAALEQRVEAHAGDVTLSNFNYLSGMPGHLRQLAIIAQDDPGRRLALPRDPYPHRIVPKLEAGGRVTLEEKSGWMANEWRHFDVSPEDAVQEARAAFAFLGRQQNNFKVDPRWLHDFPHSHALLSFVIEALRKADQDWGLPLLHPFDAAGERAAYREMVDYSFGELSRWLPLLRSSDELDEMESSGIRRFFTNLDRPGYRLTIPDQDFDRMHAALSQAATQAEQRLNLSQLRTYDRIWLDWRQITRGVSSFTNQEDWENDQQEIYDAPYLAARADQAAAAAENRPLFSSPWAQLMRQYEYASMPDAKRAGFYLVELPKLSREYGGSVVAGSEMEQMLKFALTLFNGGRYPEAETVLRQVYAAPLNDLNRSARSTDIRANAGFHLAALSQHAGRTAEAARLYREVLAAAPDRPINFMQDGGWKGGQPDSLQTFASRFLSELREAGQGGPGGAVHQIQVRHPRYFPGAITYYFRIPPGAPPAPGGYRVLLVVPSFNDGAAKFCLDTSGWARFADAHGLCLVVPQFVNLWSDSRLPERWSGDATLEAIRQIALQFPVQQSGWLLHGYGHGAEFVERFALWKPQLCSAVSVHSNADWAWQEALPAGLHPLGDLRNLPMLVTCGDEEYGGVFNLYPSSVRFVTFARDAGVPIIWKLWPHTQHRPTPEMEQLAQTFLADALAPAPSNEHFIGDLRTWKFFRSSDARAAAIPARWRQDLPSHPFALLWGQEITP
jgi:hypothetical protein